MSRDMLLGVWGVAIRGGREGIGVVRDLYSIIYTYLAYSRKRLTELRATEPTE